MLVRERGRAICTKPEGYLFGLKLIFRMPKRRMQLQASLALAESTTVATRRPDSVWRFGPLHAGGLIPNDFDHEHVSESEEVQACHTLLQPSD